VRQLNADLAEARRLLDEERRDVVESAGRDMAFSEEALMRERRSTEEASLQIAEAMADASRATEGLHRSESVCRYAVGGGSAHAPANPCAKFARVCVQACLVVIKVLVHTCLKWDIHADNVVSATAKPGVCMHIARPTCAHVRRNL